MRGTSVDEVVPDGEDESPTVLVAEDEILIRLDVSECLRQAGFTVLEAASAEEAKLALRAVEDIAAVFSDVNMPNPNDGIGLCLWMAAHFPLTPLILTSGRNNPTQDAALSACPNIAHFVPKPYDCQDVGRLLRASIAGRRKSPA